MMSIIKSQKEITKRNDILSAQFKIESIHCLNFVKLFIVNDYTEYHIAQIVRLPVNKFKKIHNIYSKIFCLTLYNKCIWNGACMVSIKNSAVIRGENKLILMAYKNLLYTGQTLLQMKTVTTFFYI